MALRFISIVCYWRSRVDLYILCAPNEEEEWLLDLYLLCAPNGEAEWLLDLYLLCAPNGEDE